MTTPRRPVRIPVWLVLIAVLAGTSVGAPALAVVINLAACVLAAWMRPVLVIGPGKRPGRRDDPAGRNDRDDV